MTSLKILFTCGVRAFALIIMLLILMPAMTQAQTPPDQKPMENIETLLDNARREAGLVGMGVGVMRKGKPVLIAVSGQRVKGQTPKIMPQDKWHWGSITKSMTATMIARLVEHGQMRWTMKVMDVLPKANIHPDWKTTTLEQLLTHTSGIRPNFPIGIAFSWPESQAELDRARRQAVLDILAKPRSSEAGEFVYSNVGYTLAGVMAAEVTGKSWEELMRQEVFQPLGLHSAGFGAPLPKDSQPWGHRKVFGIKTIAMNPEKTADNTPIMGPAGIVHMSIGDLLKYGQAHLSGERGEETIPAHYLSTQTWQYLHKPYKKDYAKGWVVPAHRDWAKGRAIWHNGSNTMWYAVLALAPNTNTVYVFVTNDGGDIKKADKAFAGLLKTLAKREPQKP